MNIEDKMLQIKNDLAAKRDKIREVISEYESLEDAVESGWYYLELAIMDIKNIKGQVESQLGDSRSDSETILEAIRNIEDGIDVISGVV